MSNYSKPLVPSDKKVKILLIEDDERQINYAQQVLAGHELTVMRSWKELDDPSDLFRQFDFIITDLMLPKEQADGSKSIPDWKVGLGIYTRALCSLRRGEVKGVALVSNLEHHVDEIRDYNEVMRGISDAPQSADVSVGKQLEWDWEGEKGKEHPAARVTSRVDSSMNYLSVFDRSIWCMVEFLDQQGQIQTVAAGEANPQVVRENGWTISKPYREVVAALLMDLP